MHQTHSGRPRCDLTQLKVCRTALLPDVGRITSVTINRLFVTAAIHLVRPTTNQRDMNVSNYAHKGDAYLLPAERRSTGKLFNAWLERQRKNRRPILSNLITIQ
jgi:hypothetical protein